MEWRGARDAIPAEHDRTEGEGAMSRSRFDVPGIPMHVVQRGVDRRPVFIDDDDRRHYLASLGTSAARYGVLIHGYVLMDNHVHLLLSSATSGAISRTMQLCAGRHGRRYNDRSARVGAAWERRFWSGLVSADRYLLACLAYIELNPVRAGTVVRPEAWRWSSAAHHLGIVEDERVTSHAVFDSLGADRLARVARWREILRSMTDRQDRLRRSLYEGRAFGSAEFRERISAITGRPWKPAPCGRPRKSALSK